MTPTFLLKKKKESVSVLEKMRKIKRGDDDITRSLHKDRRAKRGGDDLTRSLCQNTRASNFAGDITESLISGMLVHPHVFFTALLKHSHLCCMIFP
jgi:hypothetical protein